MWCLFLNPSEEEAAIPSWQVGLSEPSRGVDLDWLLE